MNNEKSFHMSPEEFQKWGHEVVDWVARYMGEVERFPVLSRVRAGDIRRRLPEHPPENGESFQNVLRDLDEIIMPGITHWQSPNFFAFFPCNNSGPSILGELISAGLGVQGMLWATSPACTELETHVLDWVAEMLALPASFRSTDSGGGVIQDSASSATLCAVLAAREMATGNAANETGVPSNLCAYASVHAHSSIEKAVKIAGVGKINLRLVESDSSFAMRPQALEKAIEADLEAGKKPFIVVATAGTTSSNAMDPLQAVGKICRRHGAWMHVDAAMSGTAAVCPEFRFIHEGLEYADSYCFNPHKWMFTNFDCDCFYVADRAPLIGALSILPEYLRNEASASGKVIDYRDWQIPLGRRFRALKLWFVIRHYGVEGLRCHVRQHVELARQFASWLREDDHFELVCDPPLNLVCFRHRAGDEVTRELMERLNASGSLYLTHTRLNERVALRMSIGQALTRQQHVERAWKQIQRTAQEIASSAADLSD